MELKNILSGIEGLKAKGNLSLDIKGISNDSREIKPGDLFIAVQGYEIDGHKFVDKAIENGATAILVQEDMIKEIINKIPENVALITAKDTREATAICACNFYDNSSRKMQLIGVTGTKGKQQLHL